MGRTEPVSWRQAKELRRGAAIGGLALLVAGTLASVDFLLKGSIGALPSIILVAAGTAIAVRATRAPRPLGSGGLKDDFLVLGLSLALGGSIETIHAVGVLYGPRSHLGLAAALAIASAWLLTGGRSSSRAHAQVVGAVRVFAALLMFSAVSRFVAFGFGEPHGELAGISMILLAAAGGALLRAGTRTPALAWQRV
jgi:hypothetical protein